MRRKTRIRVEVPVGAPLKRMLDAMPRRGRLVLLTLKGKEWTPDGFRASWNKACKKAGVQGVTFNDLRGTAVTRLAIAGANRGRNRHNNGPFAPRCEVHLGRALSESRSRARRKRHFQARKANENSRLSSRLPIYVLRETGESAIKSMAGGPGFEVQSTPPLESHGFCAGRMDNVGRRGGAVKQGQGTDLGGPNGVQGTGSSRRATCCPLNSDSDARHFVMCPMQQAVRYSSVI